MTPELLLLKLALALALLETVIEEGLTDDHRSTIELFLAATEHDLEAP